MIKVLPPSSSFFLKVVWDHPPHAPNATADVHVQWMQPEWFHSIQNTGTVNDKVIRGTSSRSGQSVDSSVDSSSVGSVGDSSTGYSALRIMLLSTGPAA